MLLLLWLLPFVIFVFGGAKDIRYIAPLVPAAVLVLTFLLNSTLPRTRSGAATGALLMIYPLLHMSSVSFGIPYSAQGGGYARRYMRTPWPHDEILQLIAAQSSFKPGEKELLLVGADRACLNANNVELSVVALQLPFNVETTAHEEDLETLHQRLAQASYFLYKEGGEPESPAFNPHIADLVRSVSIDGTYREIPYAKRLPDGGIVRIYKNSAPSHGRRDETFTIGDPPDGEEFAVDFGGILALTGISVVPVPEGFDARFQWRCIKPPARSYWCFAHLIDSTGRIVAQHDHRLLGGEPLLSAWRAGMQAGESIHFRLPAGVPSTGLRLRFGVYDPPSGDRLHIGPLQGRASSRFSLTDQATAVLAPE